MKNLKKSLRVISFCVIALASGSYLFSTSAVGLAKKDSTLKFEGIEKGILGAVARLITNLNAGPKIGEHYKALHESLDKIARFQTNKNVGVVMSEKYDAEFDKLDEAIVCQDILAGLRKRLGANVFKMAHVHGKKAHGLIRKIIDARFADENPGFKSHTMAFLTMPSEALDAGIDSFFRNIKTVGVLSQFLSELVVLLEGMRTHLPDGHKVLEHVVRPSSLELVNYKEAEAAVGK